MFGRYTEVVDTDTYREALTKGRTGFSSDKYRKYKIGGKVTLKNKTTGEKLTMSVYKTSGRSDERRGLVFVERV